MQISNITKKISLTIFALFLAFSFFSTSFAHDLTTPHTHCAGNPPTIPAYLVELGIECDNGGAVETTNPNTDPGQSGEFIDVTTLEPDTSSNKDTNTTYTWLEQLPGFDTTFDSTKKCAFVDYLNIIIKLLIGIGAVLAMVMIVMGGMEYMTSELISSKESGKDKIKNAILGLVIALSAYLILNTLNPNLLDLCLDQQLPNAEIKITGGDDLATSFTPISKSSLESIGISCPGNGGYDALPAIANSFVGKVTYSQTKRSTVSGNTAYLDCSSFVKQVYQCAGLNFPGYNTTTMFTNSGSDIITSMQNNLVNGADIEIGNLLGWKKGESSKFSDGHVVMYIGNGQFIEVSASGGANGATKKRSLSTYAGQYKHIIRLP